MNVLKTRVDQLCGDRSALPKNQEKLVFDEPWQGRAFGLALALAEQGSYQWDEFRASLIATIGAWDKTHSPDDPDWHYYQHWLASLEKLAMDKALITEADLQERTQAFLERRRTEVI
ncbi:nitrile hydratase accessory protein [Pseudomonas silvicola]|nr:nitrile hydratase accessory protein [Pseudomonas silvicola]